MNNIIILVLFALVIIAIKLSPWSLTPPPKEESTKPKQTPPPTPKQATVKWEETDYAKASGYAKEETLHNKGNNGEYLIFEELKKLEGDHRIMVNLYLPKGKGENTEIDLVLVTETGIYVFESKNYSGWIYGNEKNKFWTQVIHKKSKIQFYNPIWQNKTHIRALKEALNIKEDKSFVSYIVFSDACTLKMVNTTSKNMKLLYVCEVARELKVAMADRPNILSKFEVNAHIQILNKYAGADKEIKQAHIESVKRKLH